MGSVILLILVAVIVIWMIGAYNGLISLKNQTLNAFKQIDVQLKRRHDLIPNLVNAVKGAMDFEKSTLEAVIQARNQAVKINAGAPGPEAMKQVSQAENALSGALSRLMVVVEQYPQLKATGNIGQLQEDLTSTENKVAFAATVQRHGHSVKHQVATRRRTVLLVIGFVAFFAWLGFGGDYIYYVSTRDATGTAYHHVFPWFGIALTLVALLA